jgi:pimeloyl-ACP methyl ester carboxylesterase
VIPTRGIEWSDVRRTIFLSAAAWILHCAAMIAPCQGQSFSDFTAPLPLGPGSTLVIGFLGGWERWDDPNRGVRKLAIELRGLRGVYAETVSNHRQGLALALIQAAFGWNHNGHLDPDERAGARIILYGQSLGAAAAVKLARKLQALDIPVLLIVQIDSVGRNDAVIPANVAAAANLFQHDGPPIMGRTRIRVEDPSRTRILEKFQYRYWFKKVDMPPVTMGAEKPGWRARQDGTRPQGVGAGRAADPAS